jgi:16S rRNA (adenine1518-N6/adenine1519-N6)-dimethyltransferase
VTSVVLRLDPRKPAPHAQDEGFFAQVVKAAFATRRKTLRNTLGARREVLGLPPPEILAALETLQIDPGCRGETLSVAQFVNLSNELWERRQRRAG